MSKLIVLQGFPYSGMKIVSSAWKNNPRIVDKKRVVVSRKELCKTLFGSYYTLKLQEKKILTKTMTFLVKTFIGKGFEVMIEDHNLSEKEMDKWTIMAMKFGVKLEITKMPFNPLQKALIENEDMKLYTAQSIIKLYRKYGPKQQGKNKNSE